MVLMRRVRVECGHRAGSDHARALDEDDEIVDVVWLACERKQRQSGPSDVELIKLADAVEHRQAGENVVEGVVGQIEIAVAGARNNDLDIATIRADRLGGGIDEWGRKLLVGTAARETVEDRRTARMVDQDHADHAKGEPQRASV